MHNLDEVPLHSLHDQVVVVAHEYETMDEDAMPLMIILQNLEKLFPVGIIPLSQGTFLSRYQGDIIKESQHYYGRSSLTHDARSCIVNLHQGDFLPFLSLIRRAKLCRT